MKSNVEALIAGAISAPSNSISKIISITSGWTSTINEAAFTLGRAEETDEEYRLRIKTSQQITGLSTVEAIQAHVANVSGVTATSVFENDQTIFSGGTNVVTFTNGTNIVNWTSHTLTNGDPVRLSTTGTLPAELSEGVQYWVVNANTNDFQISLTLGGAAVTFTDDGTGVHSVLIGRPPKSVEVVVEGGTDATVALTIWQSKAAGIETHGSTSTNITDSQSVERTINYSRVTDIPLNFEVTYTLYDEELFFPNGEDLIKEAVVETADLLNIGEDVIPSRFFGPIYTKVSGIDSLIVKVERVVDSPALQTTKLPIDFDERGSTILANVTVVGP